MTDTSKAPDLLPCPFCGGENVSSEGRVLSDQGQQFCFDCGASGPHPSYDLATWNTRAEQVAVVKPLVWVQSATGVEGECHTIPTDYRIRFDDEWGWRWSRNGGFGIEVTLSSALAEAQADYDRRILAALNIRSASEVQSKLDEAITIAYMKGADDAKRDAKDLTAATDAMAEALDSLVTYSGFSPDYISTDLTEKLCAGRAALAKYNAVKDQTNEQ